MESTNKYEGSISLVMPGQVKPSTFRICVEAPDRLTAHTLIESMWQEKTSDYTITVSKAKAGSPSHVGGNNE